MHRFIAIGVVTIFVGFNVFLFSSQERYYDVKLITSYGERFLEVELAKTFREQQKGLMYRKELKVGKGMLFIFKDPFIPRFWMKDTLIPLDMLFIGQDRIIKHIEEKVPPCLPETKCTTYAPQEPVQYVLEVPGGYSHMFKIGVGDFLDFVEPID